MASGAEQTPAPRRLRDAATGLIAALGHAALLLLAFPLASQSTAAASSAPESDTRSLIEIDLPLRETPREPDPLPAALPAVETRLGVHGGEKSGRVSSPELPTVPAPEQAPAPGTAPSAAPVATGDIYGPAPRVPLAVGGLQLGAPVWTVPGVLSGGADFPGATPPGRPVGPRVSSAPGGNVLRDTVMAHDRELGIGNPGGTAITNAVESAVRSGNVPNEATAVLVARVGGDGVLISLGVQSFDSGDKRGWNSVAQAASAALGGRRLKLAGLGARGAVVHIAVRSSVTYPSGSKDVVKGRIPSLTEGPPRDVMPAPSPDGDSCVQDRWSDLKQPCGVGAKIGTFDVTDAVSRKHRNVRASFTVTLLDEAVALVSPAPVAPALPAGAASAAPPAVPAADAGAP